MQKRRLWVFVVAALSFAVVALSPLVLSIQEATSFDGFSAEGRAETALYVDSGDNLSFVESAIAQVNGVDDYEPAKERLYVKFDIEKIKNLDLAQKTIYVSGRLSGTWIPGSLANMPIAAPGEYNSLRLRGYKTDDVMADIGFPDMVQDDYFSYERILFNKLKSKSGSDVYVSEYRFSGNLNFAPNLRDFPFDSQSVELAVRHKVLPSYMLKIKALNPTVNLGSVQDFLIGSYRISPPKQNLSYVKLPYSPVLEKFLAQDNASVSRRVMAKRLEGVEASLSSNGAAPSGGRFASLAELKKLYFGNEAGPHSIASIEIPMARQTSTTWLRSIFPVCLALLALVIASYIPDVLAEVRLAIPPTILLSLVFMQQTSHDGLPELAYPMLLDYFYLLAYLATVIMFFESILMSYAEAKDLTVFASRFQAFSRVFTVSAAAFGMPLIWLVGRVVA